MVEEKPAYRWPMLVLLLVVSLFVSGMGMGVMPPLFDEIKEELGLTHTQIGVIWGAAALGGLLTTLIGGTLGDRLGVKRVVGAGIVFSAIACALRAILPGFWGLSAAMLLFGMAVGFIFPNISKTVGMWFGPRELGRALGLIMVGGALGTAIALIVGAPLSSLLGGWKPVMWLTAAISVGILMLWIALARERPVAQVKADPTARGLSAREGLRRVLGVRDLWLICLMQLCVTGAVTAFLGLFPETLEDRGVGSGGFYAAIGAFTAMVFSVIGPYFSDRVGRRKPFIWPFLLIDVVVVTFLGVFTGAPLVIVIILSAVGIGTALPMFGALVIENERIGPLLAGSAIGLLGTVARIGSIVVPITMGAIIDATGEYWVGFLLLAMLYAVAAALGTALKETGLGARQAAEAG
ncbi:putative sulfoacetate transporter SauU [subsurface metagenome]